MERDKSSPSEFPGLRDLGLVEILPHTVSPTIDVDIVYYSP